MMLLFQNIKECSAWDENSWLEKHIITILPLVDILYQIMPFPASMFFFAILLGYPNVPRKTD